MYFKAFYYGTFYTFESLIFNNYCLNHHHIVTTMFVDIQNRNIIYIIVNSHMRYLHKSVQ